uniref:Bactericidal permeability-increasing protein n=1 Tax=Mastacembelus armatus TaxID=205130 RepID=A0A7N8YDA6_9TELE
MLPSVIAVLMLLSYTCGENPAIQVILTNKGLQYGKHTGTDWIQEILENVTLPDISGKFPIGRLGSVDYTLSGISITKVDLPEPSVEFYPNTTGLKSSMSGLSVALSGEWRTHYGIIHDGGTLDLALFSVSVMSIVELGKDANGHLSISSVTCTCTIGDVAIQFYGGASWIFRPFVPFFKGHIKGEIQSRICPKVEEVIVILEDHLQVMNATKNTLNWLFVTLNLKGELYSIRTHKEPPFEAQSFTVPQQHSYMFSVGMSEFTLNSASYGCYSDGLLQATVNDSMIPPLSPVHLNTTSMGQFIPQLPKLFPGLLMSLTVYAREVPMFSLKPDAVKLDFQGTVKAFAILPNDTQAPLFTLNVVSNFVFWTFWAEKVKIDSASFMVYSPLFTLTLIGSEVGTFQTDALENVVKMGIEMAVLPKVNGES